MPMVMIDRDVNVHRSKATKQLLSMLMQIQGPWVGFDAADYPGKQIMTFL